MTVFTKFNEIQKEGKKYKIIYADPPWKYGDKLDSKKFRHGGAVRHYPTMPVEDIMNFPVDSIAADDCVLFLWGTWPLLPDALKVIEAWGFEYKSKGFVWVKTNGNSYHLGLGRWVRGNTEFVLLATKGKPKRISGSIAELVVSPVKSHSKKPDEVRKRIIQLMGNVPRIELFARTNIHGWDVFGNDEKLQSLPLEAFQ